MFKRLINHFFLNRFVLIILLSMVITVLLGLVKVAIVNWQLINLPKCHNCNIVIIDIDILRADALPCYKGSIYKFSSNICNFAEKGLILENNFSQSFWTLPSIFSTLTSLYPIAHGVFQQHRDILPQEVKTVPEILKEYGYTTVWIGQTGSSVIYDGNGGARSFNKLEKDYRNIDKWPSVLKNIMIFREINYYISIIESSCPIFT